MAGQPPLKRARPSPACQTCRLRKLSCDGHRPCSRCRQDDRDCIDADQPDRTPLTRKRMTELEDRLANYEEAWSHLYPTTSLEQLLDRSSVVGWEVVFRETRDPHTAATSHPAEAMSTHRSTSATYPPTRPASPRAIALGITHGMKSPFSGQTGGFDEDDLAMDHNSEADGDGAARNDYGYGFRRSHGYMGLSSAATLLRTLQKFAPMTGEHTADSTTTGKSTGPASTSPFAGLSKTRTPSSSRAMREDITLPPAHEIRPLVDSYFRYSHALQPMVHEPTIRAQLGGALPLPSVSGTHVLLNMIFATGAFDAALDDAGDDGSQYYEIARDHLHQELLAEGSLTLVQGLALMAIHLQRGNKPNAGYVCLGLALRMAMALGLHDEPPDGRHTGFTVLELEMRSRVWWSLVTLETGMSLTYGRPHGVNLALLNSVRVPLNAEDENVTVSTKTQPTSALHSTRYTALIMQARLAQMLMSRLDRVSRSFPSPTVEQVKWGGDQFRTDLEELLASMPCPTPPPYRLAQAIQTWRARDYCSVLYRPVFLSAVWSIGATATSDGCVRKIIDDCRHLALQNLQDINEFVKENADPHRGAEWYILYFTIQASLPILLSIVWEPHHSSMEVWRTRIMETTTWMGQLQSLKQLSTSYVGMMEKIIYNTASKTAEQLAGTAVEDPDPAGYDLDTFDFERYFAEIWDGQGLDPGGMDGSFGSGMQGEVWDAIARRL